MEAGARGGRARRHLSTVPLTELRKLAGLDAGPQPARLDDMHRIAENTRALDESADRYERQLENDHVGVRKRIVRLREAANHLSEQTLTNHAEEEPLGQATERVERAANGVEQSARGLLDELSCCGTAPALHPQLQQLVLDARRLALDARRLPRDAAELNGIRDQLEDADPYLRGQIEFALWLRSHEGTTASLVGAVPEDWKTPPGHAYLGGTLAWAREYRRQRERFGSGLFVIGELSEELGTVRGKIAGRLNETVFAPPAGELDAEGAPDRYHALSSDIGLHVVVAPPARAGGGVRARVLCTTCELDMDREPDERFHSAHDMHEVCVKGENEGIFYNCPEHDPRTQREPSFLEQLERFDVFGR